MKPKIEVLFVGITILTLTIRTDARSFLNTHNVQEFKKPDTDALKEAIDFVLEEANLPKLQSTVNGKPITIENLKLENVMETMEKYLASKKVHKKISDLAKKAGTFYKSLKTRLQEEELLRNQKI